MLAALGVGFDGPRPVAGAQPDAGFASDGGSPADGGFSDDREFAADRGFVDDRGFVADRGFVDDRGFRDDRGFTADRGFADGDGSGGGLPDEEGPIAEPRVTDLQLPEPSDGLAPLGDEARARRARRRLATWPPRPCRSRGTALLEAVVF